MIFPWGVPIGEFERPNSRKSAVFLPSHCQGALSQKGGDGKLGPQRGRDGLVQCTSLTPGIYFRLLLVILKGLMRAGDRLAGGGLVRAAAVSRNRVRRATPDHSTISRTRRLIDVETHRKVFFWILELLRDKGLVKGKPVRIIVS